MDQCFLQGANWYNISSGYFDLIGPLVPFWIPYLMEANTDTCIYSRMFSVLDYNIKEIETASLLSIIYKNAYRNQSVPFVEPLPPNDLCLNSCGTGSLHSQPSEMEPLSLDSSHCVRCLPCIESEVFC